MGRCSSPSCRESVRMLPAHPQARNLYKTCGGQAVSRSYALSTGRTDSCCHRPSQKQSVALRPLSVATMTESAHVSHVPARSVALCQEPRWSVHRKLPWSQCPGPWRTPAFQGARKNITPCHTIRLRRMTMQLSTVAVPDLLADASRLLRPRRMSTCMSPSIRPNRNQCIRRAVLAGVANCTRSKPEAVEPDIEQSC